VIELGGEGLVVGKDEGRALRPLNDLGHGEGLAGAGDAEEDLVSLTGRETGYEFLDCAGLIAARFVCRDQLKVH
jgi:hypothetical protein